MCTLALLARQYPSIRPVCPLQRPGAAAVSSCARFHAGARNRQHNTMRSTLPCKRGHGGLDMAESYGEGKSLPMSRQRAPDACMHEVQRATKSPAS